MCADRSVTILHISDIQFGKKHRFRRLGPLGLDDNFDTLLARLGEDLVSLKADHKLQPDIVILTGDLVHSGMQKEFKDALHLIEGVISILNLSHNRVVIIPGNHDVNWKSSESYFASCESDDIDPVPPFWPKWKQFSKFFHDFYKDCNIVKFGEAQPWTLYELQDLKVVIAGLNSTMAETHRPESHFGRIGENQMKWFAEKLKSFKEKGWLRIGALHHNIRRGPVADDENLRDIEDFKRILVPNLNLILHGHTHDGKIEWITPKVPILATGSAALTSDDRPEEIPNQYQIIQLKSDGFYRWARQYEPMQKKWIGDVRSSEKGDNWYIKEKVEFENVFFTFPLKLRAKIKDQECSNFLHVREFTESPFFSLPPRPLLFLGRDEDLNDVLRQLRNNGCVYVWGPPGVGKTTLTSEAVWRVKDHFKDQVIFNFASINSYDEILNFLARTFLKNSIVDFNIVEKEREIERFLCKLNPVLIYLDNLDRVDIVKYLERLSKFCSIIITSRLYAPFDWLNTKNLKMMDKQSSTKLFEASYGVQLSEKENKYLDEILPLLDGMPLAITLLATRAKVSNLSIDILLINLEKHPLSLLGISHISVEDSIELSYKNLDDSTKLFFGMLSLFNGRPFNIEAISFIWKNDDYIRQLNFLTDLSLIQPNGYGWFNLHPLIQVFSYKKLMEFNNAEIFWDRMLKYYLNFAETNRSNFSMLEKERENILSVMKRCEADKDDNSYIRFADSMLKMHPGHYAYGYLPQRGYWEEAKTIVQRCLRITKDPNAKAKLFEHNGLFHYWKGDLNKAEKSFNIALRLYQKNKDYYGELIILQRLGFIKCDKGENRECECLYRQSVEIAKKHKFSREVIATGIHLVGAALYNRCLYEESREAFEEALKMRVKEQSFEVAVTQRRLAGTLRQLKEIGRAEKLLNYCLKIEKDRGNERNIARTLRQIGMINIQKNCFEKARICLNDSYSIFEKIGNKKGIASVLTNLGNLDLKEDRLNDAMCKLVKSLELAKELYSVYGVAINLCFIAEIYYKQSDFILAAKHAFDSIQQYEKIDHVNSEYSCIVLNKALIGISLEDTCKISLPICFNGQNTIEAVEKYKNLRKKAIIRFRQKNVIIDNNLLDLRNDKRLGVSLIIRFSNETNKLLERICNSLKEIAPNHYYYQITEFHVTVMTLISAKKQIRIDDIELEKLKVCFLKILSKNRQFRIRLKGIGITNECVIAYGYFFDGTLNMIREKIKTNFNEYGFKYKLDERFYKSTAHVSMVRYCNQKNLDLLFNKIEQIKDSDMGISHVDRVDLVLHDWFMSKDKVKILASYYLK